MHFFAIIKEKTGKGFALMQNDIRKSNDYYMNTGMKKTEIQKSPKSPFNILAVLIAIIGLVLSLGLNLIYVGIGLEVLALIFAIIHRVIKKKGIPSLLTSIFCLILSIVIAILPVLDPTIYDPSSQEPVLLQIIQRLTGTEKPIEETEAETESETEPETTESTFDVDTDYISGNSWQLMDDNSVFYFLEDGYYYWCQDAGNFDDNYYWGAYQVYRGDEVAVQMEAMGQSEILDEALANIPTVQDFELDNTPMTETESQIGTENETESGTDDIDINLNLEDQAFSSSEEREVESETESIASGFSSTEDSESNAEESEEVSKSESESESENANEMGLSPQLYLVAMTNDLCYENGEDITIEYQTSKPVRYCLFYVIDEYNAGYMDLDSYTDGWGGLTRVADADLSSITSPTPSESESESQEETGEEIQETVPETQGTRQTTGTVDSSSFSNPLDN